MPRPREAANYRRPVPRVRTARWLLIGILTLTFSWLTLVGQLRVVGMGHVQAEEIILSPEYEGRITRLSVACNDRVAAGQVLAVVGNPIRTHTYREELAAEEADARTRQAVHDQRLAVATAQLDAARRRLEAARQHLETATALATATEAAWRVQNATLTERVAAGNAEVRARAGAASAEAGVRRREADLERVKSDAAAQMAGFVERVAAQRARAALGDGYELRAPFDGVVTDCPRDVGDIVRPSVAVLRLQRTGSARIFVWVPATDAGRLAIGMPADVVLSDSGRRLSGTVNSKPAEVGSLPRSLKRYFWQNQAWQQYARVEIVPNDPTDAATLPGETRVDAVIRTTDLLRLPFDLVKTL